MFIDFLGNEIKVGDLVTYPALSGRSCQLELGHIEEMWHLEPDEFKREVKYLREISEVYDMSIGARRPLNEQEQQAIVAKIERLRLRPGKMRVRPVNIGSRWSPGISRDPKDATRYKTNVLTANAPSVIRVTLDSAYPPVS